MPQGMVIPNENDPVISYLLKLRFKNKVSTNFNNVDLVWS